jgi:hypothetical protein
MTIGDDSASAALETLAKSTRFDAYHREAEQSLPYSMTLSLPGIELRGSKFTKFPHKRVVHLKQGERRASAQLTRGSGRTVVSPPDARAIPIGK